MRKQCFYFLFCVFALGFSKAQIPGEFGIPSRDYSGKDYAAAYDSLEYNGEILDFPIANEAAKQDDSQSLKRLIDDCDSDFLSEKSLNKLIEDENLVLKDEAIKDAQKFLTTEPGSEMKLEENSNEPNLTEKIKSLHEQYLALENNDTEIDGKLKELHKLTSKKPESFDSKGFIYDVERIFTEDNVEKRKKYYDNDDKPLDDPIQEDKRKKIHQQVGEYQLNLGTDTELFNPFTKENLDYLTDNEWPEFEQKVDIPQKIINNVGEVPNDKRNDKLFDDLSNSENSVIKSIVEETPQNQLKIDGKEIKDNIIINMSDDGKINVKEEILDEKKDNEKEVGINDDKEETNSNEVQTEIHKMVIVIDEEDKNDKEEMASDKEDTGDDKQEIVKDQEEKGNNMEEKIKQKTIKANDKKVTINDKMATVKDMEQLNSKADLVNQLQQQIQEYIDQTKKHNEDVAFKVKEEINLLFDKLNATDEKLENKQKESEDNDYRTPVIDDQEIIDEDEIKYLSETEEILDEIYDLFPKFENLKHNSRSDINKQIRSAINQLLDELNLSIKNNMKFEPDYNENDEISLRKCADVDSTTVLSYLFEKNNDADIKTKQLDPILAEEMSIITDNIRKKETNLAKNKFENYLEDINKEHDHNKTVLNEQQMTQMETEKLKNIDQAETTTTSIDKLDMNLNKNLQQLIEALDKSMSLSDDFYNNQNFSEQNASEQENNLGSDLKNESFEYDDYVYDDNIFDNLTTKKTDSETVKKVVSTTRGDIEEVTQSTKFIETKDLTPQQYDELIKQFKLVNSDIINPESESFARNVAPIHIKLYTDEPTVITSPNYPMPYPTNNIVDWIFEGEGSGIEMNITDFAVNGAIEDYVLIKPGGLDESGNEGLVFTYSLTSPRRYRFLDVDHMFIRFQSNQGLAFAKGFQISLKMIKPPKPENDSHEEEDSEDLLPPITAMYTVNLGGLSLAEFKEIEERFRLILADMATMYCNANGIDMGLNTTTEVTQINNTYICNINWPNFESCVSVRFGVPLVNETGTTGRLHEEDLAAMWATYVDRDPFAARLSRLGITEFTPPAERQVLSAWLLIGSAVFLTVALLAFALWRFSCIEEYTRMPAFSDTESVQQEKRDLDLYPTPHQTLPPLYEEPPFSWDQPAFDGSTRVDIGAFSNRNFVGDELFDIDSDQDFNQDVGDVRDRNARPKDYNV